MGIPIKSFSLEEMNSAFTEVGFPSFRSNQIAQWLYAKNAKSYDNMTNLPKTMREQLSEAYPLHAPEVIQRLQSTDGTRKYLLEYHDGACVETVAMPSNDGRLSVCCSSQSGCAMKCAFCATGRLGLNRSLTPGEIVDQILLARDDYESRITNIVVMGQGEPFANYNNTLAALRIINHPKLLNIGARHITLSTCGLIPGIRKFSEEPEQFTLAVSLHSASQRTRDDLMPACKNYPLEDLRESLIAYTKKTDRRMSFEYALMSGINDSSEDLKLLIDYCRGLLCHVNLIPLNRIDGSDFHPSPKRLVSQWRDSLENAGIAATIRESRGCDIAGACGQLAGMVR